MRAVSRYLRCQVAVAPLLVAADADVDLVLRLQFRRHHDEAGRRVARRLSPNPSRWNSHFISWLRFFWCVCVFLVGFLFVWFVDFGFVPFNRTFIPRQLFFCSPYSPPCSVCVCVCVCGLHSIEEHLQQGSMCGNQVRVLPDTQVQVGDPSCPINEHGTIPCTGPFRRRHPLDRLHSRASGGHRGTPFFSPCSRFQIHRMKFPCSHTTRRGVALQYTPPTQDIESHAG